MFILSSKNVHLQGESVGEHGFLILSQEDSTMVQIVISMVMYFDLSPPIGASNRTRNC